jgi:hypothetical protein
MQQCSLKLSARHSLAVHGAAAAITNRDPDLVVAVPALGEASTPRCTQCVCSYQDEGKGWFMTWKFKEQHSQNAEGRVVAGGVERRRLK